MILFWVFYSDFRLCKRKIEGGSTKREDLKEIREKCEKQVPLPLHTLLKDTENKHDAVKKHKERKEKITTTFPPTCSCIQIHTFFSKN